MNQQKQPMQTENTQPAQNPQPTQQKATPKKSKPIKLVIYLVAIFLIVLVTNPYSFPFMPESVSAFLSEGTNTLFGDMSEVVEIVSFNLGGIVQVIVMVLALLVLREVFLFVLKRIKPKTPRGMTLKDLTESAVKYIIVIFGIFWALSLLGVNITTLFAGAGILALIIGFGAESLIADIVTGTFMIFENQFNIGDVIEIDGFRGTVTQIGLRTTSVKDIGENEKIFNNSDIRNIINLSNEFSYAICDIAVPYTADLEAARTVINTAMQGLYMQNPNMFKKAPEFLGVQEFTSEGVLLRVRASVSESDRFDAARAVNWALKVQLQSAGMGVPYSSEVQVAK